MNRLDKSLRQLHPRHRPVAIELMRLITAKKFKGLNIKKLKGFDHRYRVRKGKLRIIFDWDQDVTIRDLDTRDDNTYNF